MAMAPAGDAETMTTVVTGASGHVGANLTRQLLGRVDVRGVVHRDRRALAGLDMETVQADLQDPASLRKAFRGADTVYHLAGRISIRGDPDGLVHAANVVGARNAAEAALAEGVTRFVHVSSVHAFDLRTATGAMNETHRRSGPGNYAYDHSKAQGEAEVRKVITRGLDATFVNPTGIIGPNDFKPSRMGQVFLDLEARRLPAIVEGAFDFVDVRDVVASTIAARDRGATGENHLLAGHRLSVRGIARLASAETGVPAPRLTIPAWIALAGVPFAAASARRTGEEPKFTRESLGALRHCPRIDDSKARHELGHRARSPEDSVHDIYAWFHDRRDAGKT